MTKSVLSVFMLCFINHSTERSSPRLSLWSTFAVVLRIRGLCVLSIKHVNLQTIWAGFLDSSPWARLNSLLFIFLDY